MAPFSFLVYKVYLVEDSVEVVDGEGEDVTVGLRPNAGDPPVSNIKKTFRVIIFTPGACTIKLFRVIIYGFS